MTGDPSIHLTEHIPPRIGDPIDPNAEVLGAAGGPAGPPPPWESESFFGPEPPPAPRRRLSWRFGPRSLTARLVTGVVALVVILVLATGLGTYFFLSSFLISRLDQQLVPIASGNQTRVNQCVQEQATSCPIGGGPGGYRAPQTEWLTVLDSSGGAAVTVPSNDVLRPMSLTLGQRKELVASPSQPRTLTTTDGSRLRVSARMIQTPVGNLVVVSGLATDEIQRTLHRLIVLEWAIGGAAVIVAFAATFGGVQFSLRRLRRVTATAHEVAAELSPSGAGLDRRVPVDETGTEVGQLAVSMNTLLSAVETQFAARLESEQRMRQFLADASHELRTPLTSIRGYAELARMQRDFGDEGDPANLDRIESEGTRMSRLIDDLLMLARSDQSADAGVAPVRELIDVDALLDDVVSGARAAFGQREFRLSAPPGLTLVGDPDQLVRAIRNLVNNAAIHTNPEGPIVVDARRQADTIVIQVADSGPGLPPDEAAHVFERFWRADKARTRARGGSGLGMSIVASIIQGHGGSVRFDSSVAAGSTVTIQLPAGIA